MPLRAMLVAAALGLATAGCARQPERPNVLLVTVDALPADHLGSYGGSADATPALDRLAAEGLRFERACTPRGRTTPALASLLSGLYPQEHGVRDLATPLGRGVPLLQEALRRAGYRTGAVIGNWAVTAERSGLARGFDLWVESLPEVRGLPPRDAPRRSARSLTDAALVALGLAPAPDEAGFEPQATFVEPGRPWMLWLHYADPHGPLVEPGGDRSTLRETHAREVSRVDAQLARLLEHLHAAGLGEGTLVVVTADHGETLDERAAGQQRGPDDVASYRVPLILRLPAGSGRPPPGVRRGDVSLVDLAPTLLELLRLPPLALSPGAARDAPRGAARLDLVERDDPRPRPVFCEATERADQSGSAMLKAVRMGRWMLTRRYQLRPGLERPDQRELVLSSEVLHDLQIDRARRRDLAADPPRDAPLDSLRRELDRFVRADARLAELDLDLQRRREELERGDPETLRRLEALGY